jgi:hypothetical protein
MLPYITFQATNQRRAAKHEGITIGIKKISQHDAIPNVVRCSQDKETSNFDLIGRDYI